MHRTLLLVVWILIQQEEINHFSSDLSEIKLLDDSNLSAADKSLIYYISGYIARASIGNCEGCNDLISLGKVPLQVNIEAPSDEENEETILPAKEAFIESVSRGGLIKPSNYLFNSSVHAASLYTRISLRKSFLSTSNPRATFIECFVKLIESDEMSAPLLRIKCIPGHSRNKQIRRTAFTIFNISAKNYASNLNDDLRNHNELKRLEKRNMAARKIKKLQGQ